MRRAILLPIRPARSLAKRQCAESFWLQRAKVFQHLLRCESRFIGSEPLFRKLNVFLSEPVGDVADASSLAITDFQITAGLQDDLCLLVINSYVWHDVLPFR